MSPREPNSDPRHKSSSRALATKLFLTACVMAVAAMSMVGLGAMATFNSNQTTSQSIGTGTVSLTLGTNGTAANRLNVAASNIAPGDTMQRAIDIINGGTLAWNAVSLTTTATTSSVLDTDATNGLQMTIDDCSVAWTEAGVNPNYTYTCSGTQTNRVASRAVIGSGITIAGNALTAGATGHYRVTLQLATTADNTFESKTSVIQYSFTGTQRTGTNE